jgi:hypothetical protein
MTISSHHTSFPLCLSQEDRFLTRELSALRGKVMATTNIVEGLRVRTGINVAALVEALKEIIARHVGLRSIVSANLSMSKEVRDRALSCFERTRILSPGMYIQNISSEFSFTLERRDLTHMSPPEQDTEIENEFQEECTRKFNYSLAPLIRATLLTLSPNDNVLIIAIDHHVSDGWSMKIIVRDLEALYAYYSGETSFKPTEPTIGFPQFAALQIQHCQGDYFNKAFLYWVQQWAEYCPSRISPLDLPSHFLTTSKEMFEFRSNRCSFDLEQTQAIRRLAHIAKVTVHTVFVALATILLRWLTGRDKLAIWGYFYNRSRPEVQQTVGFLINRHLLGFDLSGDPSVIELLQRSRLVILEAVTHEEMPIEYLWWKLQIHPRFDDTRFVVDYRKMAYLDSSGYLSSHIFSPANLISNAGRRADWGIYVEDYGTGIFATIRYWSGLFSETGIQELTRELVNLITLSVKNPNVRLSEMLFPQVSFGLQRSHTQMAEWIMANSRSLLRIADPTNSMLEAR